MSENTSVLLSGKFLPVKLWHPFVSFLDSRIAITIYAAYAAIPSFLAMVGMSGSKRAVAGQNKCWILGG